MQVDQCFLFKDQVEAARRKAGHRCASVKMLATRFCVNTDKKSFVKSSDERWLYKLERAEKMGIDACNA